jgi:hypothetical protein
LVPDGDKFKFGSGSDLEVYHDGTNGYIANQTGELKLATETTGIAVTIGNATSEVTIADNLTVTGNTTLNGTLALSAADINGGTIDGVTLGTNSAVTQAVVDNINLNGATIGHTDDTDLITLADGLATVTGALTVTGNTIIATATPASASASGTAGQISWDSNYVYICISANTWKRVAIASW